MKLRFGFVSNSSSSSFVIPLDKVSAYQLRQIQNHLEEAKKLDINLEWCNDYDAWDIEVKNDWVEGSTFMDNFSMEEFLEKIGVQDKFIKWSH